MFNLNYLELFILNTIIYFDLFDYSLNLNEIYTNLFTGGMEGGSFALAEIEDCLATSSKLKKFITTKRGFYFLRKKEEIIETRLSRYALAEKKLKIAKRVIKILKYLPFIKLMAICNSLSYRNANQESDIDLFIITSKNRIWLVRLFSILVIAVMGLRPPKNKVKDKICLSFFTTEENLDLSQVKITAEDIYLVFWLATLRPIYERDNFYEKFIEANSWFKKYLPNWQSLKMGYRFRVEDNKFSCFVWQVREFIFGGFLGNWLESFCKKIQMKFMSQKKKDQAIVGDKHVIISDTMLKFHENDRRLEYQDKFEKKRTSLLENL